MNRIFTYPSRNLHIVIPIVMILGGIIGLSINMEPVKGIIRPLTFIMVLSAMIGFPWKALFSREENRILLASLGMNFLIFLQQYG